MFNYARGFYLIIYSAYSKDYFHSALDKENSDSTDPEDECYEYELIGVTVHTGNAEGGHYYSFIRERNVPGKDKW